MTEVNEQPTPEGLDPDVIDELADDTPADMRTVRRLRSENARLRHRLRESEANRHAPEEEERALARLAMLEKRAVEREAAEILADGEDIWRVDAEMQQEFVDAEFGEIVGDRIKEAARALIESKPHLARRVTPPPTNQPVESLRAGASPEPRPKPTSWTAAIRGH